MIFTSESGLTAPNRLREWDEWYLGHLAAMAAVPGISSAQRFRALGEGVPPSLAMYTVASPEVFESEPYRRTRGMGPFVPVVEERLHRRNLFDGLDVAPEITADDILLVADRAEAEAGQTELIWLDRSMAYRGIAVFRDLGSAREMAGRLGRAALYAPITRRFS